MGCFDSVNFTCPECYGLVEVQSKAGESYMAEFDESAVPPAIAHDIEGETVTCGRCRIQYVVELGSRVKTERMRLRRDS